MGLVVLDGSEDSSSSYGVDDSKFSLTSTRVGIWSLESGVRSKNTLENGGVSGWHQSASEGRWSQRMTTKSGEPAISKRMSNHGTDVRSSSRFGLQGVARVAYKRQRWLAPSMTRPR